MQLGYLIQGIQGFSRAMSMFECQIIRESLHVQLVFKRPILEWHGVPGRFFNMIYAALGSQYSVNAGDFSYRWGNTIAELQARYSVFGGASGVLLLADKLIVDIPNLLPNEFELAMQIIAAIHDALPKDFSEANYESIEIQTFAHLDLMHEDKVAAFLEQYRVPSIESAFAGNLIVNQPSVRFQVVSTNEGWSCTCMAERSALKTTGIYAVLTRSIGRMTPLVPFHEKFAISQKITNSCLKALGLEMKHVQ